MAKRNLESEIEIGELLVRCPDEDGDFLVRVKAIRRRNWTTMNIEEMKDIVKFLKSHIKECEDGWCGDKK